MCLALKREEKKKEEEAVGAEVGEMDMIERKSE